VYFSDEERRSGKYSSLGGFLRWLRKVALEEEGGEESGAGCFNAPDEVDSAR
jgi:hypothetical protein|tara:strand:+ start:674 stop:829 length:156 start_codon:yes stop_codon:yes gene_type:complete